MNEGFHPGLLTGASVPAAVKVSVLGALFAPESPQRFLQDFWPERVFHAHGPLSRLPAPFTAPELSSFAALAASYRGQLGFGRGAKSPRMISMAEANPAHLYELGLSVYLPDLAQYVPGTEPFLRALERELGLDEFSCHMTVWASPEADGAAMHFDGEDVISVQLAGTKELDHQALGRAASQPQSAKRVLLGNDDFVKRPLAAMIGFTIWRPRRGDGSPCAARPGCRGGWSACGLSVSVKVPAALR